MLSAVLMGMTSCGSTGSTFAPPAFSRSSTPCNKQTIMTKGNIAAICIRNCHMHTINFIGVLAGQREHACKGCTSRNQLGQVLLQKVAAFEQLHMPTPSTLFGLGLKLPLVPTDGATWTAKNR